MGNLGVLYAQAGLLDKAGPMLERALTATKATFGQGHPSAIRTLGYVANLRYTQGRLPEARKLLAHVLTLEEAHARAQFATMSSAQRRRSLRTTRERLSQRLSWDRGNEAAAYPDVLRFKGLVTRAEAAERLLARRATAEDRKRHDELRAAERITATLANSAPPRFRKSAHGRWQRAYAKSVAERDRLSLALTQRMAPLRQALERLDLGMKEVRAQLAPDEALVDVMRVTVFYVAWVVRRDGPVRFTILGDSEKIEPACAAFVEAIAGDSGSTDDQKAITDTGKALAALIWRPIEKHVGKGVGRVVICPDGALAAVPYAALPGRKAGSYLMDDLTITHVMSAQDLVPRKDRGRVGQGALLVGGVDYEKAEATPERVVRSERVRRVASKDRAGSGTRFAPLPGTLVEAQGLRAKLGEATSTLLVGAAATETALRNEAQGKRFVHIATHGFARENLRSGLKSRNAGAWMNAEAERALAAEHDPLLLSGLALAGVNNRSGGAGDDGVFTALEASYLDLDSAQLITLSACETARGTAAAGEGVLGLVQGFQLAGAKQVVASLWKVDDDATTRMMLDLYDRLLTSKKAAPLPDALRAAARALRDGGDGKDTSKFARVRYWAAFVAYGR